MSKDNDIDDLLGDPPAKPKKAAAKKAAPEPAKKAAAKKAAPEPAKKAAPEPVAKKAAAKKAAEPATEKPKRERVPIVFEEGEREELAGRVMKLVKKAPQNSRALAERLEIPTRKLRALLYSLQRNEQVTLSLDGPRTGGMTVSAA